MNANHEIACEDDPMTTIAHVHGTGLVRTNEVALQVDVTTSAANGIAGEIADVQAANHRARAAHQNGVVDRVSPIQDNLVGRPIWDRQRAHALVAGLGRAVNLKGRISPQGLGQPNHVGAGPRDIEVDWTGSWAGRPPTALNRFAQRAESVPGIHVVEGGVDDDLGLSCYRREGEQED